MKFVADGMLGKLTRWLRMLGYDVEYSNKFDDAQLITIARAEKRILLTKDLELYQQATARGVDVYYLEGSTEDEKLAELAKRFRIKLDMNVRTSRCPKCNVQVEQVSKEDVLDKVEKSTSTHYSEFWICPKCRQIYWRGAHWMRIKKTLERANQNLDRLLGGKSSA